MLLQITSFTLILSAPLEMDLNAANVTLNMHNLGLSPHSSCLHADVQQDPKSYKTVGSGEIITAL